MNEETKAPEAAAPAVELTPRSKYVPFLDIVKTEWGEKTQDAYYILPKAEQAKMREAYRVWQKSEARIARIQRRAEKLIEAIRKRGVSSLEVVAAMKAKLDKIVEVVKS